jgi:hypothetical protein
MPFEQHLLLALGTVLAALCCSHPPRAPRLLTGIDLAAFFEHAGHLLPPCLEADLALCLGVATP